MSARHNRNSLAPVSTQIADVYRSLQSVAEDIASFRETMIEFTTKTDIRLCSLETSFRARAERGDKIRSGAVMALIGAAISAGVGLVLNAIL